MTSQFEEVARRIEHAGDYFTCFGPASEEPLRHVRSAYRGMAHVIHPDRTSDDQRDRAQAVFDLLSTYHRQALDQIAQGKYGEPVEFLIWKSRLATHHVA